MPELTAQKCADFLNELMQLDKQAVAWFFKTSRSCNKALADHAHIRAIETIKNGPSVLRFVDLLSGMLMAAGSSEVVVVTVDDQFRPTGFSIAPFTPKPEAKAKEIPNNDGE